MSLCNHIHVICQRDDARWSSDDVTPLTHQIFEQVFVHDQKIASYIKGLESLTVSVVLTNDLEVQALNAQFRNKDKPTNVLSFPASDYTDDTTPFTSPVQNLGDIIMAYETVAREAREQNKKFENHFTHLLLHSILHLFGYDHMDDTSATRMETIETKILAFFDIPNPYHEN